MIIPIDHGNKQCKTLHKVFVSGIIEHDNPPPFGDNTIFYKGKYYTLSDKRIPYMRDKSIDEKFFILTLFAIAYEIDMAGRYSENDVIGVTLLIGLPPSHFGPQYEKFEEYFTKRNDLVEFEFNRRHYNIYFNEVMAFPQAYAAAMLELGQIKDYLKATVIDIGGYTADYLQLKHGRADMSACDSLDNGVIILYNNIKPKINADYDMLLDESDIDAIITGTYHDIDKSIKQIIDRQAGLR